jgi:uncharacterized membrane protein
MPDLIESYVPQVAVAKMRRQAFFVWSVFAFVAATWVCVILFAPVAAANGWTSISQPIYKICSYICHQIPARSFYLENHPFAVCARCFGVYFGLLSGFIIYPFLRSVEKTESFPRFWLFLAMIPMGVDWSLGFFHIWENTHVSRFLTGLILGMACAIFIIPALVEIFELLARKKGIKKLSR